MNDLEYLLTDEFQDFSKKIAAIHSQKKEKEAELKKVYEQFKSELKAMDAVAYNLVEEWNLWKADQEKANST